MSLLAIDQSIRGTAWCHFLDGKMSTSGKIDTSKHTGFGRVVHVVDEIVGMVKSLCPSVVAMEDYARQAANSSSLIPLVELGGCIKLALLNEGFGEGWSALSEDGLGLFVQGPSTMKKFVLGKGNVSKDSGYLLAVYKATGIEFQDDDLADAYMHGVMASTIVDVLDGKKALSELPKYQLEVLMEAARSNVKGLTKTKAMKLPDEEKLKLIKAA